MPCDLLCGFGKADITPKGFETTLFLAGFAPERKATGILDPIEACALSLELQGKEVVLASLDVIGFLYQDIQDVKNRLRKEVMPGYKGKNQVLIVCSTHNHNAPDTIGLWGKAFLGKVPYRSGVDYGFMWLCRQGLRRAIKDASRNKAKVQMKVARFEVPSDLTRNERKGGTKDDFGYALGFYSEDGALKACLVSFGAHAETLWEHNTLISADFPGALRRRLAELGCSGGLFVQGALGAMVTPNCPLDATFEQRCEWVKRVGYTLADKAKEALDKASFVEKPMLLHLQAPVLLPLENKRFYLAGKMGLIKRDMHDNKLVTEMHLLKISDNTMILTVPGEISPEASRRLLEVLPCEKKFLIALGGDEIGYILTEEQFKDKEYSYEQSMSVGPKTLPCLIETAKRLVDGIKGLSS